MNDREFEQRLRAVYRDIVADAAPAPDELWSSVIDIPERVDGRASMTRRRQLVILAAAAMLATLLIGSAIAIGSGLIRVPWLPDDRSGPFGPASTVTPGALFPNSFCEQSLPDGYLLHVERVDGEIGLTTDGMLQRAVGGEDPTGPAWEQRQVTADGVRDLLAGIERGGLRDCQVMPSTEAELGVIASTEGGVVSFGFGELGYRVASQDEIDRTTALAERLGDPELGLRSDEFVDDEWADAPIGRLQVRTVRWEGELPPEYGSGIEREDWAEIVMPDGSPISVFGDPLALHESPEDVYAESRCRTVGAEEADAIRLALGEPQSEEDPGMWQFHDETGGIVVFMPPLRLLERACLPVGALQGPEPERANLIPGLRPCAFHPTSWTPGSSDASDDYGGGWATCENFSDGWVFISRHPVSAEEAEALAAAQFGEGFHTATVDGRTVYLNACLGESAICADAVAISAPPYFVIVAPDGPGDEARLLELAAEIVASVDR